MSSPSGLVAACVGFVVVPAVVLSSLSFATLHTIEYGLDFNAITMNLRNKTYSEAGLKFLGFGHTFLKYPRTIQTIEFTPGHRGLLHTRTSDGLPLTLGLSFQYRYIPIMLHELWLKYEGKQELVYVSNARAIIANTACNYSAYEFFNDKQGIAMAMQMELNKKFERYMGATVEAFQISDVELPDVFQNAIVTSISMKQNITRSERYKDNMQVTFTTEVMVARQSLTQTVTIANGEAQSRLETAAGNAKMTEQTVGAEMIAFQNVSNALGLTPKQAEMIAFQDVSNALGLTPKQALDYIWWDQIETGKDKAKEFLAGKDKKAKEFLAGINPAAYIQ